jgi:hexulose-6-phosphate isomerase
LLKCISYWSFESGLSGAHPIEAALAEAGAAGFDGLELCIGTEGVLHVGSTRDECERIRQQIDRSGLVVETLASGMSWGCNPTSDDPAERARAVELHAAALRCAAWLGCRALLFVPGIVTSPIAPGQCIRYDDAVVRVRDAVGQLLEVAQRVGVDLCLENVWNGLFYSPLEWIDFIDSFTSERLGIYFDAGNVVGYQQHPPHWIELLGHRIRRVHVKDFSHSFGWQGRYEFCRLGRGDVPLAESIEVLAAIGYDRTVVAEMLPWSEGLIEDTSRVMDRFMPRQGVVQHA